MRYWSGFASGVSALSLCVFAVIALSVVPSQAQILSDFGQAPLPAITVLVMSASWRWGALAVFLAAIVGLNLMEFTSEGRRTTALAIAAAFVLLAIAFTNWALYAPMFELSGTIRAE